MAIDRAETIDTRILTIVGVSEVGELKDGECQCQTLDAARDEERKNEGSGREREKIKEVK